MASLNEWKANLYDDKLQFVSDYGKSVVDLLQPQAGERILDLGCGTGDLTSLIAASGATVHGVDYSASMIETARKKYPREAFFVADAEQALTGEQYDAVFSNAALHWMNAPQAVIANVWKALVLGGRFVAELGGHGNVATIYEGVVNAVNEMYGIDVTGKCPWYFPTLGQYSSLLEQQGFRVLYAVHFDRPTALMDGEQGLHDWLDSFAGDFLVDLKLSYKEKEQLFARVADRCRPQLFRNGGWIADYRRLRFAATKL
ncbi:class I SAM-dependent methyltransferase [Paenibacillus sp. 481]|uniref:class I SAM-dependent methyltransferase n=1 Tax=Paenibacillus sp. 481 TaxID=2835869 RepID=UPI001E65C376|nr:class I SAM-dependent methyltransferase [Paenibacillus sp. 481]UHA74954.1 methyltransferase domain-containing protein [Paenibacillus sp. 481]